MFETIIKLCISDLYSKYVTLSKIVMAKVFAFFD